METLSGFLDIIPYLSNPLSLIGFALLLIFGLYKSLIKSGILPPVNKDDSSLIVRMLLTHGTLVTVLIMLLGFGYAYYQEYNKDNQIKKELVLVSSALAALKSSNAHLNQSAREASALVKSQQETIQTLIRQKDNSQLPYIPVIIENAGISNKRLIFLRMGS